MSFHDWWIYLVATGASVPVINDEKPGVFYRQHAGNVLGSRVGNRTVRLNMLRDKTYAGWIDRNILALCEVTPLLTDESQEQLRAFVKWRATSLVRRNPSPTALGLYRQSWRGDLILRAIACTGRL